jgi:hypothetical protein
MCRLRLSQADRHFHPEEPAAPSGAVLFDGLLERNLVRQIHNTFAANRRKARGCMKHMRQQSHRAVPDSRQIGSINRKNRRCDFASQHKM